MNTPDNTDHPGGAGRDDRDGLVEAIARLADEWTRLAGAQEHPATRTLAEAADDLRTLLTEHPVAPAEGPAEMTAAAVVAVLAAHEMDLSLVRRDPSTAVGYWLVCRCGFEWTPDPEQPDQHRQHVADALVAAQESTLVVDPTVMTPDALAQALAVPARAPREFPPGPVAAPASPSATAGEREVLTRLLGEHRPNVVTEEIGPLPLRWRTRIKCDGNGCDFYTEHERYWTAAQAHTEHLTDVVSAHTAQTRAAQTRTASAPAVVVPETAVEATVGERQEMDRALRRAVNQGIDDYRMGLVSNDGIVRSLIDALLASEWLVAHDTVRADRVNVQAWEAAHDVFCPRGQFCSTHLRPGDRHHLAEIADPRPAGAAPDRPIAGTNEGDLT